MATYQQADLRTRAAEHLGVKSAGEAVSAEDAAVLDRIIASAHEECTRLGYITWPLTEIPARALQPMAEVIAHDAAPSFGIQNGGEPSRARMIVRLAALDRKSMLEPMVADYF